MSEKKQQAKSSGKHEDPGVKMEYDRQRKTLEGLPKGFNYPLFNGWQAIQSQRKSAYKTTARAAREIVDNAIEAGAKKVHMIFDIIKEKDLKPHQRKNTVTAIAFVDDGPGMIHESNEKSILRYALSWGGGTHFYEHEFISKFGFGLPNSSINQTEYTEVYTRTARDTEWNMAALDIRRSAISESGEVRAGEVSSKPLPKFVMDALKAKGETLKTGTVVIWWNPDCLSVNTRVPLREHLEHDFQVVYRGLLDRVKIYVDSNDPIIKVDPIFLDPTAYLYLPEQKGGAICLYDEKLWVKHFREEDSGRPRFELIGPEKGKDPETGFEYDISFEEAKHQVAKPLDGQKEVGIGTIQVHISSLPYPTFVKREMKKVETDAGRRFEIRKRTRGISYVRSGRELDTRENFPKRNRDEMGNWPLLEAYDYYWGFVVSFDPPLDDGMSVGHDKQTVEPIEDFWKILHQARVDEALSRARRMRHSEGENENQRRNESKDADAPSVEAANQATRTEPPNAPGSTKTQAEADEAEKAGAATEGAPGGTNPQDGTEQPPQPVPPAGRFGIEFFEAEGGVFMEPKAGAKGQVIVRLNRKHPWYGAYANPATVLEARNATNLLLLALAAVEIRADDEKKDWFEDIRVHEVSRFLNKTVPAMHRILPKADEQEDFS